MHSLITSYLLQSKECVLPGIGSLKIIHTPARTDHKNNLLLPPSDDIIFQPGSQTKSAGLIKYIADKTSTNENDAEDQLISFCNEWKTRINNGNTFHLDTIGFVKKNADGKLVFENEEGINFPEPIPVISTYQKSEELVRSEAEKYEPVTETAAPFEEHIVERSYWGIWALILLAIGFVVLFYHFKDRKLNGSGIGNQHHYIIDSAKSTYTISK